MSLLRSAALVAAIGVSVQLTAHAQGERAARPVMEEVVVTAQKREQNLQEVPLSVAVVSEQTLRAFNLNEATDLQYLVPGVQVANAAGPRSFGFFIRGIGTSSFASESVEGSVAYVLDGVVLGQAGSSLADLPDIERIEVLRGPQATLFGKNASAGVINVVTRTPSHQLEAVMRASYADPFNDVKASAYVTGPISDSVRFLVSGRLNQRDGLIDNLFDNRSFNDRNDYGARARIEITPTEKLTVSLIGDYSKREADCCIWTFLSVGPNPALGEQEQLALGVRPGIENDKQNLDGNVFSDVTSKGASAQVDYEFGDGYRLTSISAWRGWDTLDGIDGDNRPLDVLNTNFADFSQTQYSQELRIASPQGRRIEYVAGLFFFKTSVDNYIELLWRSVAPTLTINAMNRAENRNAAVFGQADIHITDKLTFIAGARALRDTAEASKQRHFLLTGVQDFVAAETSEEELLWRAGLQYELTPQVTAFATATRGYKGGGFDTNVYLAGLPEIFPERPTNFEIGARTTWPALGLLLNATAFYTEVEDYQVQSRDPGAATAVFRIQNAASVVSKGVEADLFWAATDNLSINSSAAYIDATWDEFPLAQCFSGQTAAQGCVGAVQNLSGQQVPLSSKWTATGATRYSHPLGTGDLKLQLDLGVNYQSQSYRYFPNDPNALQGSLTLINASIGLVGADERWQLAVFGRNLGDRHFAESISPTSFGVPPYSYRSYPVYEARRILGVSAEYRF